MAKRPVRSDDILKMVFVGDAQFSPVDDTVLYARKTITEKNKYLTQLWTVDLHGNRRQWTQGDVSCGHGRWSPDGTSIAFLTNRRNGVQIFVLPVNGGEAHPITDLSEGSIGDFAWSPDGTKIALTWRPSMLAETKAAKKVREEKGLSEAPIEIDSIWYRFDGDGYFANQRYELLVIDATKPLSAPILRYAEDAHGEYEFDWSPSSDELVVTHNVSSTPFRDVPNKQLWRLKLDGTRSQVNGLPRGEKSAPKWSPDGQCIAFAGDVDEADPWGTRNTKIYLTSANGDSFKDLTGHLDFDFQVATLSDSKEAGYGVPLFWAPDGSGLFSQVGTRGEQQLAFVSVAGTVELLTKGHHIITVGNVASDGLRVAGVSGNAVRLPEVVVLKTELATGNWAPTYLTAENLAFHEEVETVEPIEIEIPTTDGLSVHGWYLKPVNSEGKQLPTVLQIHGGPHTQYGWAFFHEFQSQVGEGFAVVYTNPRGSKGYGEAWTSAIRGDWGHKDWEDIQAATAWIKTQDWVDTTRMAVMGGSYGGYMTNWVIGHTTEFACAITDRCVSNFVSMAGNSDFPFNKDGYFKGIAWGDLADIESLWRQSPISYFKNVKTPTLVIHSVGDLRCNIEQSEQVFTALQMEGVPSRFVRYPVSTSHGMSRSGPPDLRMHRLGEILNWLKKWLA